MRIIALFELLVYVNCIWHALTNIKLKFLLPAQQPIRNVAGKFSSHVDVDVDVDDNTIIKCFEMDDTTKKVKEVNRT